MSHQPYCLQPLPTIPSFNHSLNSSRKSSLKIHEENLQQYGYTFNVNMNRSYGDGQGGGQGQAGSASMKKYKENKIEIGKFVSGSEEQYWGELLEKAYTLHGNLKNKYGILEEAIKMYRQTLGLRNYENLQNEGRVAAMNEKIKKLTRKSDKKQKQSEQMSMKCHKITQEITRRQSNITKQQQLIHEQNTHIAQIQSRIEQMQNQIQKLHHQIDSAGQKQQDYLCLQQQNQQLSEYLNKLRQEAQIATIKMNKDMEQEQNIANKMKEMEKVIVTREKRVRELGKRLLEVRKAYPEAQVQVLGDHPTRSTNKLKEVQKNLRDLEEQYAKIQQQIFDYNYKIDNTSQRLQQKIKVVQRSRLKYKNQLDQLADQSQRAVRSQLKLSQNNRQPQTLGQYPPAPPPQMQSYQLSHPYQTSLIFPSYHSKNSVQKPLGYRVIQSEQNQQIVYPKQINYEQQQYEIHLQEKSSSNQGGYSERQQSYGSRGLEKGLNMTESIKNLMNRYENVKNNSKFKK